MPPILPATKTILQTHPHKAKVFMSLLNPRTLLQATVVTTPTRNLMAVPYIAGTGTGFSEIGSGTTLWVGTAPGLRDVGKVVVKSISGNQTSGTINVAANPLVWQSGYYITVKKNYELWTRASRLDNNGVLYKDYDIVFAGQAARPVAVAGPHRAGFLDNTGSITFNLDATDSYPVMTGDAITAYYWDCDGGTIASPTSDITTITFDVSDLTAVNNGQFFLSLTVTSAAGSHTTIRVIFVHVNDPTSPYYPYINFSLNSNPRGNFDSGSWTTRLFVHGTADFDTFQDGALFILWTKESFGTSTSPIGLPEAQNQLFAGYSLSETVEADWNKKTVYFEAGTIIELTKRIRVMPFSLQSEDSPATWYEYPNPMTVAQAGHHCLFYNSTLLNIADVRLPVDNTLGMKTHDFSEGSLYSQFHECMFSNGLLAPPISNKLGQIWVETVGTYLSDTDRAALPTVSELEPEDMREDMVIIYKPLKSTGFTRISGLVWDGTGETAYCSVAPGVVPESSGGDVTTFDRLVISGIADANRISGRINAVQNNPYPEIRVKFAGNYVKVVDIIPQEYWTLTIPPGQNSRGIVWTNKKIYVRSVECSIDLENGVILTDAIFEPDNNGVDGIQFDCETEIPPEQLPPPDPTVYPTPASTNPALVSFSFGAGTYVLKDGETVWQDGNGAGGTTDLTCGCIDPNWTITQSSLYPENAIFLIGSAVGEIFITYNAGAVSWADISPNSAPPNSWGDTPAPTLADVKFIQILGDPFNTGKFFALGEWQDSAGIWRGALAVTNNYGADGWDWKELDDGSSIEYRPFRIAIDGGGNGNIYVTAYKES